MDENKNMDEVEKVKVGEKEYTPDELNKLVGLGEIAVEAEEKYNRPISKFWPEYTKLNQEHEKTKLELEELRESSKSRKQEVVPEKGDVLEEARRQLKDLGFVSGEEAEKRARDIANEVIMGYKLVDQVDGVLSKKAEEGFPQASREDLLSFMNENNIVNPEVAYKIKFEKELDEIKEKKLASLKSNSFVTESRSTAGSKQPAPIKVTKDNLTDAISAALRA